MIDGLKVYNILSNMFNGSLKVTIKVMDSHFLFSVSSRESRLRRRVGLYIVIQLHTTYPISCTRFSTLDSSELNCIDEILE